MAVMIKCKMCGGDLALTEGSTIATCEYCGTTQTVPTQDNEKKFVQFERAERLRKNCEFDKAAGVYESIVADFRQEAEAYWGMVLCKYGIEYVDDPATGKKVPTCHRSSFESILDDSNFEQTLENADAVSRKIYREEAKAIEEIRKGIIEVSSKEEPYDVFICYKETDEKGERTMDSVLAQDIYDALTEKNYRVFFSRISLEDKLGQEYEPYIFSALNSAKVMLAIGTDYEHYNAVWVKNEWSRFLKLMEKDKNKHLIPCFKDIDAYDMPKEFNKLQAQDMGKVGAMQDLLRGIDKLIAAKPAVPQTAGVQTEDVNRLYIYNSALEALNTKNVKSIKEAIQKLRSLGDWKDAPEQLAKAEARLKKVKTGKTVRTFSILGAIVAVIAIGIFAIKYAQNNSYYERAQWYEGNYEYRNALNYYDNVPGFKDTDEKIVELKKVIEQQDAAMLELVNGDELGEEYNVQYEIKGMGADYSIYFNGQGGYINGNVGGYYEYADAEKVDAFFGDTHTNVCYDSAAQEYFFVEVPTSTQLNETIYRILFRGKLNSDGTLSVYNDAGESYTLSPQYYYKNGQQMKVDVNTEDGLTAAEEEVLFVQALEYIAGQEFKHADTDNWFVLEPLSADICYLIMPEAGIEGECRWEIGDMQVKIDVADWGYEGYLTINIMDVGAVEVAADSLDLSFIAAGKYNS